RGGVRGRCQPDRMAGAAWAAPAGRSPGRASGDAGARRRAVRRPVRPWNMGATTRRSCRGRWRRCLRLRRAANGRRPSSRRPAGGRAPPAGDAWFRRYEGPRGRAGWAVLMDAPPDAGEDCRPFVAIGAYLRRLGFSAPAVLAADMAGGFLLLEDLGDDLYARVL